jgi:hypothetical protein
VPKKTKILVLSPHFESTEIINNLSKHLKLKHHDMLDLVKNIFERSKDDDVKERLPDGKVPGKELQNIESGVSLDYDM